MLTKIKNLKANNTYNIVDLLAKVRAITLRFIYKRKIGYDGKIKTYKARLVARGF